MLARRAALCCGKSASLEYNVISCVPRSLLAGSSDIGQVVPPIPSHVQSRLLVLSFPPAMTSMGSSLSPFIWPFRRFAPRETAFEPVKEL